MRPSALAALRLQQLKKIRVEGELVWSITTVIGSRIGASKTNLGGLSAVRDKPTEICVWNRDALQGHANTYKDIEDYMCIRKHLECGSDRFFLAANLPGTTIQMFFKRQHLGRNSFSRIVKDVCKEVGIVGSGFADGMTAHGLRGTVVSMLFEAGCSDANVAMRTGHRDLRSLKSYHNLRGALGINQQEALFAGNPKKIKMAANGEAKENVDSNKLDSSGGGSNDEFNGELKGELKTEKESRKEGEGEKSVAALLAGVHAISGGTFNFNVHNHYR